MKTTEFIEQIYKIYEDNDYDSNQSVFIIDKDFWVEAEPIEVYIDNNLHIGLRVLKKRNQKTYKRTDHDCS